jgi:3-deoxy-manno-octulosonate cytidylyltransferase (CMP-KDO synthetase)
MHTLIVIPARKGSSRFPGKPLAPVAGVTLLRRVIRVAERAAATAGADYLVATDDPDIAAHAREAGARAVLTPADLASGTDRAYAAAAGLEARADLVVNLQGDSPFTPPEHVAALIEAARSYDGHAVTPVVRLDWEALDRFRELKRLHPMSGTSCVADSAGEALWFSKQILPAIRDEAALRRASPLSPVLRHVGLYAYRFAALEAFVRLPPGRYETLEGLEQLRLLENGLRIRVVEVAPPRISISGIDTPEDVRLAEALIAAQGDPYTETSA